MSEEVKNETSEEVKKGKPVEEVVSEIVKHFELDKDPRFTFVSNMAMFGFLVMTKEEEVIQFIKEQGWENECDFEGAVEEHTSTLFPELENL